MLPVVVVAILLVASGVFAAWRVLRMRRAFNSEVSRLERQNDIGRVLLTDRNVRGVTHHVARTAAELLGAELGHVTLVDEGGRLVLEAATGALAHSAGAAVPAQASVAGWVVKHMQPLVVNDPDDQARFLPIHDKVSVRRSVTLPLIARGRCVGALGVDNPRDGRRFGQADVELLRDLAEYAALTIEAIQAIEELRERERHAALLNFINSRVRQSLELPVILDTAVRELGNALGASRCYVRLRRGGELLEVPAADWGSGVGGQVPVGTDPIAPLIEDALRRKRTCETADVRQHARPNTATQALTEPLAALATPILLQNEVAGVLVFEQAGLPRLWRQGDVSLIEEAASELAIAISNARMYRSVEDASRELASKIEELEKANRLKAQFLANMSHELRTPLNSVIGFSEILLNGIHGGRLSPEQRDALETISRNGRHLLSLVNDVLDLSKVDAGRMELHLAPVDLSRVASSVLQGMESLVRARGHSISCDVPEGLVVQADETRARQVLFNLLSNAVKFTPPGGDISVRARRRNGTVWLGVTDTGIGIPAEEQHRLFSEFSQLDASHSRRYEGTGLGLALCKRFMDLHGGRIGVESAPGRGSTFWVEFPGG